MNRNNLCEVIKQKKLGNIIPYLKQMYLAGTAVIPVNAYSCMPPASCPGIKKMNHSRIQMTAPSFKSKKAPGGNRLELFSLSKISLPFNYFSA